mgnify:CR=1 FL=1
MDDTVQLLENYRRVRFEEYASAVVFGLGMIVLGYETYEGTKNNENTFSTLICAYLVVACSSLSSSSFEQGRKMSKEVSRLEKELESS